jgi:hypothetical protein
MRTVRGTRSLRWCVRCGPSILHASHNRASVMLGAHDKRALQRTGAARLCSQRGAAGRDMAGGARQVKRAAEAVPARKPVPPSAAPPGAQPRGEEGARGPGGRSGDADDVEKGNGSSSGAPDRPKGSKGSSITLDEISEEERHCPTRQVAPLGRRAGAEWA